MNDNIKNKKLDKKKHNKNKEKDNFQTVNMIEKIKKVKKKKSKMKENYKNIEEFTTLHDMKSEDKNHSTEEKSNDKKETNKNVDKFFQMFDNLKDFTPFKKVKEFLYPNKKEGFKAQKPFKKDDYEGYDTIDDREVLGDDANPREMMIRAIEKLYKKINYLNRAIAEYIVDNLSVGTPAESDYFLVQESISWIFSAVVSSYMVYNWYFLMFYSKDSDFELIPISRMKMLENSSNDDYPIFSLILFFFEFSIMFVEKLDNLLINIIPSLANTFLNGRFKFSLIYLGLIYFIKNSLKSLKDFLIMIIKAESSTFINLLYGIIAISLVVSMMSLTITGVYKVDVGTVMSSVASMANPFGTIMKVLFRLFFVMATNVPFAGIFITFYLFIYSLFSTLIYAGEHKKGINIFEDIDEHVMNSKSEYEKDKDCGSDSNFFYEIIRILNIFVDVCYNKLLPIVLTIILIVSTINFSSQLSDIESIIPQFSFKTLTIIVFSLIIGILVPYIYSSSASRFMKAMFQDYKEKE